MSVGSAIPTYGQFVLSSTPIVISTSNIARKYLSMLSTAQWAVCGSSTATSTSAYIVPANVPLVIADPLTTGAIYGCASTGLTPTVSTISF